MARTYALTGSSI